MKTLIDKFEQILAQAKVHNQIADYRIDGHDIFIQPIVPVNFIHLDISLGSFDGDVLASTGKDIRLDNSTGD